jgi:putative membrane protein
MPAVNDIQWWCSARGSPWSWTWQPYPGVWLFVAAVALLLWRLRRGGDSSPGASKAAWGGVLLLWITLDWPLGPLGTGYLASVHALQFIALAMIVPPLLILAVRDRVPGIGRARLSWAGRAGRLLTQPLITLVIFIIVMGATHMPRVVDGLMRSQAGAFALDLLWVLAGILFWWPVLVPSVARARFVALLRMLYLFFGTQGHLLIAMWLLIAEFPVYATYELAPRVTAMSALRDQQVAGAVMLVFAGPLVLGVISVMFFRWAARLEAAG